MADFRFGFDVIGASYSAVPGVRALRPPFPDLGGRLKAAYNFGWGYTPFCPSRRGRIKGNRHDWSESGQDLDQIGLRVMDQWWMDCTIPAGVGSNDAPRTSFSVSSLEADPADGVMIVAYAWCDAASHAINLVRASNDAITERLTLALLPQSNLVRAASEEADVEYASTLTPITNEEGVITMYAGHWRDTDRTVYTKAPGQALRIGTPNTTDVDISQTDVFYMGVNTGSGTGINRFLSCAFYNADPATIVTDLGTTIPEYYQTFHEAVNSGLTLPSPD
jgi:hypothetical protein